MDVIRIIFLCCLYWLFLLLHFSVAIFTCSILFFSFSSAFFFLSDSCCSLFDSLSCFFFSFSTHCCLLDSLSCFHFSFASSNSFFSSSFYSNIASDSALVNTLAPKLDRLVNLTLYHTLDTSNRWNSQEL